MVANYEIRFGDNICIDVPETADQFGSYVHTLTNIYIYTNKIKAILGHLTNIHSHSVYVIGL